MSTQGNYGIELTPAQIGSEDVLSVAHSRLQRVVQSAGGVADWGTLQVDKRRDGSAVAWVSAAR